MGGQPPKIAPSFFGLTRINPKRYLDQFSRFCKAHERDK